MIDRCVNRFACWWSGLGLPPRFQAALEVPGRTSGRKRSNSAIIATVEGKRYLVSMLARGSDWVKNVEAAHGDAVIRQGRRRPVHLVAAPADQRAPILREYVRIALIGRQHFPLPVGAPLSDFEAIAGLYTGSIPHEGCHRHLDCTNRHLADSQNILARIRSEVETQ